MRHIPEPSHLAILACVRAWSEICSSSEIFFEIKIEIKLKKYSTPSVVIGILVLVVLLVLAHLILVLVLVVLGRLVVVWVILFPIDLVTIVLDLKFRIW